MDMLNEPRFLIMCTSYLNPWLVDVNTTTQYVDEIKWFHT